MMKKNKGMDIIFKLTLNHLKQNKNRTRLTIISVVISVTIFSFIYISAATFNEAMRKIDSGDAIFYNIDYDTAEKLSKEKIFSHAYIGIYRQNEYEAGKTDLKVYLKDNSYAALDLKEAAAKHNTELPWINSWRLEEDYEKSENTAVNLMLTAAFIITCISSVFVIGNAFYISSAERSRQFALLRNVGATKRQIMACIMTEGFVIASISIVIGLAVSLALQVLVIIFINVFMSNIFPQKLILMWSIPSLMLIILTSYAVTLISAYFPSLKASKFSLIESIKSTDQSGAEGKPVKIPRLVQKLFKTPGVLAVKSLKLNKSRQRATFLALVMSIAMFIAASSYGTLMTKVSEEKYAEYAGYNFSANLIKMPGIEIQPAIEFIENSADINRMAKCFKYSYYIDYKSELLTQDAKSFLKDTYTDTNSINYKTDLLAVDDVEFEKLCGILNENPDDYKDIENPRAIFIDKKMTVYEKGKAFEREAFNIAIGEVFTLYEGAEITVQCVSEYAPEAYKSKLTPYLSSAAMIVSKEVYDSLYESCPKKSFEVTNGMMTINEPEIKYLINTADPYKFEAELKEVFHSSLMLTNLEEETARSKNKALMTVLIINSFVFAIFSIASASIIISVTTNITLRRKEFAVLRSVGMTHEQILKMLWCENAFYLVKALFFGGMAGMSVAFVLYQLVKSLFIFDFAAPLLGYAVSILFVGFLISFIMRYSYSKMRNFNIIDGIKNDNI